MEIRPQKKPKRNNLVQTSYKSYKDNAFLLEAKQQPTIPC